MLRRVEQLARTCVTLDYIARGCAVMAGLAIFVTVLAVLLGLTLLGAIVGD